MEQRGLKVRQAGQSLFLITIFILLFCSHLSAQDSNKKLGSDLVVFANLLSVHGVIDSGQATVTYNGLALGKGLFFFPEFNKQSSTISSKLFDTRYEHADMTESETQGISQLNMIVERVLEYLIISDEAKQNPCFNLFSLGHINGCNKKSSEFGMNLFVNIGYDSESLAEMEALEIVTFWNGNMLSTVYNCNEQDFILGFRSKTINKYLPSGMQLEMKVNPESGTGAVMFSFGM